jgi:serine protease SohB
MFEFLSHFFSLAASFMHVAILGVVVLIGLSILSWIGRTAHKSKVEASKCELVPVHESTIFTHKKSLKDRATRRSAAGRNSAAASTETETCKPLTAVIRFEGDVVATGRQGFAELVDEAISNKDRLKEVVVVVNSPGGGVAQYGQMYSEMERLRKAGLKLTACVDTYAASGGYLMSVPANRIVSAPFSMVGSIGVVSEFLNFSQLLKTLGIQALTLTAGEYKRTVTQFSEVTEEGKAKYLEQLAAIHRQFIKAVTTYRNVDADKVCTGDHWTAAESVELNLNLVDELATSQEYLFRLNQTEDLVELSKKVNRFERGVFRFLTRLADHCIERIAGKLSGNINV